MEVERNCFQVKVNDEPEGWEMVRNSIRWRGEVGKWVSSWDEGSEDSEIP